jgi:hypothetical protein
MRFLRSRLLLSLWLFTVIGVHQRALVPAQPGRALGTDIRLVYDILNSRISDELPSPEIRAGRAWPFPRQSVTCLLASSSPVRCGKTL